MKNFCSFKDWKSEEASHQLGENTCNLCTWQELVFRMDKEFLHMNKKKAIIKKTGQQAWIDTSQNRLAKR